MGGGRVGRGQKDTGHTKIATYGLKMDNMCRTQSLAETVVFCEAVNYIGNFAVAGGFLAEVTD